MTIIVELDFGREGITPDWSLVAWAAEGEVTVRHTKGLQTDSFPFIERIEDFDFAKTNSSYASVIA